MDLLLLFCRTQDPRNYLTKTLNSNTAICTWYNCPCRPHQELYATNIAILDSDSFASSPHDCSYIHHAEQVHKTKSFATGAIPMCTHTAIITYLIYIHIFNIHTHVVQKITCVYICTQLQPAWNSSVPCKQDMSAYVLIIGIHTCM